MILRVVLSRYANEVKSMESIHAGATKSACSTSSATFAMQLDKLQEQYGVTLLSLPATIRNPH